MEIGYILTMVGMGMMVGLAGCGSAIGCSMCGSAVIGMMKKRPEMFGNGMVLTAVPATQGLYGLVGFILYQGLVGGIGTGISLFQGSVVFGAGFALGLVAFISAIQQAKVCTSGINGIAAGNDVFGKTMILAAFPEFYAILSLIAAILMTGLLNL